jgi:hypothetical protein
LGGGRIVVETNPHEFEANINESRIETNERGRERIKNRHPDTAISKKSVILSVAKDLPETISG